MRTLLGITTIICLLTVACQKDTLPDKAPSRSPTRSLPSPVSAATPTVPLQASPSPLPSAETQEKSSRQEIDHYLTWFVDFALKRASANGAANKRTRQLVEQKTDISQSLQETVELNQKLATEFVQEKPPTECSQLSQLYATVLLKSIVVMEAKVHNHENGVRTDASVDLGTSQDVAKDLKSVNEEINRLYKKYPDLQTPKLELTQ